jgi:hypothetical protein
MQGGYPILRQPLFIFGGIIKVMIEIITNF